MSRFVRQQAPPRFTYHREYVPFLRIDFRQRCAYCERPEAFLGGTDFFTVDHFQPKSNFPLLANHYANLYYACGKCNQHKSDTWPTPSLLSMGFRFSDPCEEDMYVEHARTLKDGSLKGLDNCGLYTCDHIRLNRPDLLSWRRLGRQVADDLMRLETAKMRVQQMLKLTSDPTEQAKLTGAIATIESLASRGREQFGL